MSKMMELVRARPVSKNVLADEEKCVVLVGLPIDGICGGAPVTSISGPVFVRIRAGVELATSRATRQLESDRVGGVYVVVWRLPGARQVLPVLRCAVEITRFFRFDCEQVQISMFISNDGFGEIFHRLYYISICKNYTFSYG